MLRRSMFVTFGSIFADRFFNFSGRSQMIKSGMTVSAHCAKVKDIIKTVNPHHVRIFQRNYTTSFGLPYHLGSKIPSRRSREWRQLQSPLSSDLFRTGRSWGCVSIKHYCVGGWGLRHWDTFRSVQWYSNALVNWHHWQDHIAIPRMRDHMK